MEARRYDLRPLTVEDTEAAGLLGREAFGMPDDPAEPHRTPLLPGRHPVGAFDAGRLVAKVVDREFDSWFGGVAVPTAGIAGVAVAAEHRGEGLVGPLFAAALGAARARGAVLSGLFPTQPGIYRRQGYELVASYDTVRVPTADLRLVEPAPGVTVRRAGPDDADTVLDLYERWAREQNGPLTLRGASFPDPGTVFAGDGTAVSLAERDGEPIAFATWDRGQHYGERAVLEVGDLVAVDPAGLRALLRMLGSFASVVPTVAVDTSGDDVTRLALRSIGWARAQTDPYMIKVLDVVGLLSRLRYPAVVDADLAITLAGDPLTGNDGGYRLRVSGGRGMAEPSAPDGPVFTPQGLAVVLAGAQSCANARFAGLLTGSADHDSTLDALFGGRQPHIRTYY